MSPIEKLAANEYLRFGINLWERFDKLKEETNELFEAVEYYKINLPNSREHILDEINDVRAVINQISFIMDGLSNDESLIESICKVRIRESIPDYKKQFKI